MIVIVCQYLAKAKYFQSAGLQTMDSARFLRPTFNVLFLIFAHHLYIMHTALLIGCDTPCGVKI